MSATPLGTLFRHPRRLGFAVFNLIVLALVVLWLRAAPEAGLADLPNFALANVGMVFVLAAWVISWLAWVVMVLRRRRSQSQSAKA
jgi:dolichyl-phosphate-mannose--protein O-mannosyl transferase